MDPQSSRVSMASKAEHFLALFRAQSSAAVFHSCLDSGGRRRLLLSVCLAAAAFAGRGSSTRTIGREEPVADTRFPQFIEFDSANLHTCASFSWEIELLVGAASNLVPHRGELRDTKPSKAVANGG